MKKDISKRKISIYEIILYGFPFLVVFWFFTFLLSLQLPSKYENLQFFLFVYPAPIALFFLVVLPIVVSKVREKEVRGLLKEVKQWKPIVEGHVYVKNITIEFVHDRTLDWLNSIGAHIYENRPSEYILAFHEIYDSEFKGIGVSSTSNKENWEKFFEFYLLGNNGDISVDMRIHQGSRSTFLDSYENRKRIWPRFIEDYRNHLNIIENEGGHQRE